MRPPSTRFLLALHSIVSLATLSFSPFARAQTDSPAAPLPALPATPPASPEPASPAAPPPTPIPPAPPPVETSASPASAAPVVLSLAPYRHQGFYLGETGGFGYLSAHGSGPRGDASIAGVGVVYDLGIGGTIAPGLVLGGVIRGWMTNGTFNGGPVTTATTTTYANGAATTTNLTLSGNARIQSGELGAFLDWYPNPEKGWHVGGSLGLCGVSLTDDAGTQSTAGGIAGAIFGGHQWWLGPSWSLGLAGVVSLAGVSHLDDSGQKDTGYKLTPVGIGLQTQLLYY
jgi:hypothetical protein